MCLDLRHGRTATGNLALIARGECEWQEFPKRARAIVASFNMRVIEKIDGLDVRMWITTIGDARFCISWDIWFPEVSVMAWEETSDVEVERLVAGNG